jgi:hypothetical protein
MSTTLVLAPLSPPEVTLFKQGGSLAFVVPKAIVGLKGWQPNDRLSIQVVDGGVRYERPIVPIAGGKNLAIVLTSDIVQAYGLHKGDKLSPPFDQWGKLPSPPAGDDRRGSADTKRSRPTRQGRKHARHGHPRKRRSATKKAPRKPREVIAE